MKILAFLKILAGFVALAVGGIGVFVPVLPTTPFVLLSVGCFSSSPKIRNKILKIKFVNEYYNGYTKKSPIRFRTILFSLIFLWVMLGVSMFLVKNYIVIIILAIVGVAVSVHLLYMALRKSKKEHIITDKTIDKTYPNINTTNSEDNQNDR